MPVSTLVWVFALVLTAVGATVGSVRRIDQGNEALVQRLGRYHRKLSAGLNFGIFPVIDEVVIEANTRERTLDIEPSEVITRDSVTVKIDAVIFWRIIDLYSAYYEIDDVSEALKNLVITTLRSKIGEMALQDTYASREKINKALLESLDEATEPWGVKVTRVEIQDIKIPDELRKSLESERASQSLKRAAIEEAEGKREAAIAEAEGERQAAIKQAEAVAESIRRIADVMPTATNPQDILRYLVMQRYVDANMQLGKSDNSKVVFMNPRDITENIDSLLRDRLSQYPPIAPSKPDGESAGGSKPA
ncbi:MAG: paraslipin [Pegethrix bostrychoides GSE-TBD4-15B]|jgi:regulator of protease activity HflC (stomatin/prohibitin superfamily)|uniref:Paraslipin n=1 Tax=Pegethrix bostrychoides GSE-TBD4-15B TaxID=2839662 RepID=A0A951U613_9CYAN|nr:paraslipin [Pegethrix bostrychoides GSE-TBD4-15B]